MSASLPDLLIREIGRLLDPISYALENPRAMERLLASVGIASQNDELAALTDALSAVANLRTKIDEIAARPSPSFGDIAELLELSDNAFTSIRALSATGGTANAFEDLGKDLTNLLVADYLFKWHPLVMDIATLLTLIEPADEQAPRLPVVRDSQLLREPFYLDRFRLDRIGDLLRDPVAALRADYGGSLATVDEANAVAEKLFPRLLRLLRRLEVPCHYGFDPDDADLLGDAAPLVDHALLIYAADTLAGAPAEAGVVLTFSSADRGDLGLVVCPFGALTLTNQVGNWEIALTVTAEVETVAYGRHGVTLLASASTAEVGANFTATLAAPDEGPAFIFGAPNGSRLEVGGARLTAETVLSEKRQAVAVSAAVSSSALVIAPGDADSFLSRFLPADGLRTNFDLGLAWSNGRGFALSGNAGLEATLPVGLSVGGVSVPTVHLGLRASDAGLESEVSASVGLSIGPVRALVDRIGINTLATFPEEGGNLGVAELEVGFKSPSGIGLVIEAAGVSGGGFLFLDREQGQYAGVVLLNIEGGITVKALGLIATRLPNGAKGFSFVVMITAEGFKPIPLGLGFTLTGVGGLLAINRTCNEEFLREGIKNQTLDHLLFPKDPVRNAAQIFGTLNNAFPPKDGSYLFGPVVQICWGTPPILTMDLGVVLELGHRKRVVILGRVSAVMPSEKHALLRLQMNALGVIDFDRRSVSLDAVLYDSRLVNKFPLTGGMAMRLNWGASPSFALSVGGFHPAFKPPSGFPALARLALSLSETEDFRLRCSAYFAITSNTLQFGAHAELFARAAGFSIEGRIGFDVLIQFDPFGFLADFHASVQLKRGRHNLFAVKVKGALAGPRPLHVKGKATFEIFWCDFSVGFDKTLVSGEAPPPPEPVNVLERLKAALDDPRNWGGQLGDGERRLVTLREARPAVQVPLHPLSRLAVKQNVVPLDLEIAKFGNATPAGARLFKIGGVSVGGNGVAFRPEKDSFAPAQFLELSDDEKLLAPSFETMTAGVSVGADGFIFTADDVDIVEDRELKFETIILDKEHKREAAPFTVPAELLSRQLSFGAAARSDLRRTGFAKFRPAAGKNAPQKRGWTIVSTEDGSPQAAPGHEAGKVVSYAESFQALVKLRREHPARAKGLMLIRVSAPVTK